MTRLWDVFDGEPFLDNPHLSVLVNKPSKRRKKKMARRLPKRNRKGQFIKGHRAKASKRRVSRRVRVHTGRFGRKVRRVRVARHPVLVNPKRRSRSRRRYAYVSNPRRRRSYRSNPIGGLKTIFAKPTLKNVGFAVVGIAGTPMLTGFLNRYLPAAITSNKWGAYAVKAGSAYGLSLIAGKVAGKDAERSVLIGGLAYVALGLISDFFPTLLGTGTVSAGTGRYLKKQPLLASYMNQKGAFAGAITAGAPSRLDPAGRF